MGGNAGAGVGVAGAGAGGAPAGVGRGHVAALPLLREEVGDDADDATAGSSDGPSDPEYAA